MKYVVLFFICLGLRGFAGNIADPGAGSKRIHPGNKIDTIQSAAAIESLVRRIDKKYSEFQVTGKPPSPGSSDRRLWDSLGVKPWTKADFDGNGYTDLLVFGNWSNSDPQLLCIMDKGENNFFVIRLTRRSFQEQVAAVVKDIDNKPSIVYCFYTEKALPNRNVAKQLITDTLVFRFDDFIERNPAPARHSIEKIAYSTTRCFGTCPVFSLVINADRSANYQPIAYNKRKTDAHTTIDSTRYDQLTGLLNYIDFENLNNNYEVDWTDDQTCILVITYDNGKTKKINDYGLLGSFGLNKAYSLLSELRENQDWK